MFCNGVDRSLVICIIYSLICSITGGVGIEWWLYAVSANIANVCVLAGGLNCGGLSTHIPGIWAVFICSSKRKYLFPIFPGDFIDLMCPVWLKGKRFTARANGV